MAKRGKDSYVLVRYKGRSSMVPVHGGLDLAPDFLREVCEQLGLKPQEVLGDKSLHLEYPVTLRPMKNGTVMAKYVDVPERAHLWTG